MTIRCNGAGCVEPRSRYLLGLCCYRMGRLLDAEQALCDPLNGGEVVNGAAGHYLLGLVRTSARLTRKAPGALAVSSASTHSPLTWATHCCSVNWALWSASAARACR
jgi:hypothetical protein